MDERKHDNHREETKAVKKALADTGIDALADTGIDALADTGIDALADTGIDAKVSHGKGTAWG